MTFCMVPLREAGFIHKAREALFKVEAKINALVNSSDGLTIEFEDKFGFFGD